MRGHRHIVAPSSVAKPVSSLHALFGQSLYLHSGMTIMFLVPCCILKLLKSMGITIGGLRIKVDSAFLSPISLCSLLSNNSPKSLQTRHLHQIWRK